MNLLLKPQPGRRRRGLSGSALTLIVVGWWLALGGAVVWLMHEPTASATSTPSALAPEQMARIHQPGMPSWPIPVSRAGFDAFQRGVRESDEAAIEEAFTISEWIDARHGQAVRIITVDGDAVQVELLEGTYAGRQAWLKARNLSPAP
jgi:hypothetical protein